MKFLKFSLLALVMSFTTTSALSQASGNYNYFNAQLTTQSRLLPSAAQLAALQAPGHHTFSVKGLYNCKAQSYLAIFSLTQAGKNQVETEKLVRTKTEAIQAALAQMGIKAELYVDMISFMPLYEIEETKKLFSKNTYNEIPKGFELKKNLHFKYTSPQVLDKLVTLCASQEIYDLVKVDYFIADLEAEKAKLMAKAEKQLNTKMTRFKRLLGQDFKDLNKQLAEGFAMHYPIEQYQRYLTYVSNSVTHKSTGGTPKVGRQKSAQTASLFYQAKPAKGYDFVINPSLLEPVVQIEYELKLQLSPKPPKPAKPNPKPLPAEKQIFIISPDGNLKKLSF